MNNDHASIPIPDNQEMRNLARSLHRLDVRDHQLARRNHPLFAARLVAKGWGHGGYNWYAVMDDGELMCAKHVRENWRQIVRSTRDGWNDGWCVVGYTSSDCLEGEEFCAGGSHWLGEDA